MAQKHALFIALIGAVAALALAGCTFQASAKAGGEEQPPPPPPPPPPPAAEPAPAPKAEEPAPEPKPKPKPAKPKLHKDGRVTIPGNIVFDTGKATLKEGAGSEKVLEQLKQFLDENPRVTLLRIEGHTDNVGSDADNLKLSGERALTIKNWLIDKKIKQERLLATGFGETKPIADNSTADGRAQNRRTEFHVAKLDGRRYLGQDPKGGGTVFK